MSSDPSDVDLAMPAEPSPAPKPERLPPDSPPYVLLVYAALFGMFNFVGGFLILPLAVVLLGVVTAELLFTSILAVMGTGPWFFRWLGTIVVEIVLWGLFMAGLGVAFADFDPSGGWLPCFFGCLPLVSLAAKAPLVPLRVIWGFHLARRGDEETTGRRAGQFGIADLFGAITLSAIALSLAQASLRHWEQPWLSLANACTLSFSFSLLWGVPCLIGWAFARNRGCGCLLLICGTFAVPFTAVGISVAILGPSYSAFHAGMMLLVACASSFALTGTLIGSLALLKTFEIELRRSAAPTTLTPSQPE